MNRFLVVIPARNESKVLPRVLQSLRQLHYPSELLKIVVVADNCTDNTAEIARQFGVQVMERHDLSGQTKAYALGWAFYQQGLLDLDFDALTVLDADNLVDPDFFRHVDRQLQKGTTIVQGRRIASNATKTCISAVLSIIYTFESRFWHLPHANKQCSTQMFGTGATIRRDHLKQIGWNISTLVEDAEFSIQSILAGASILYCDEAVVKVQMPTTVPALWRQLRRWFSGQIHCSRIYLPAIWQKVVHDRGGSGVVMLITLIIPFNCTLGLIQLFLAPITTYKLLGGYISVTAMLTGLLGGYLIGIAGALLILLLGYHIERGLWKGIALFPILHLFYGFVYLTCYFVPKKKWEPMQHE